MENFSARKMSVMKTIENQTKRRKEKGVMTKNSICIALLLGLLLSIGAVFAQGSGSDWQYCNAFNVVSPEGTPGGPVYGTELPSYYTTDYSTVSSFTPVSPWRRGAYEIDPVTGLESPVRMGHDNVVLRLDMLSGTDDKEIRGITLNIWGSRDFDPNEDLTPILPPDAATQFGVDPTEADTLTGVQFYIDKGASAGSDIDILDRIDIMGIAEQILTDTDTLYLDHFDPTRIDVLTPEDMWTMVATSGGPYTGWKKWRATIYFQDGIAIPYEGTFNSERYGLEFYRIWIALQMAGCHDCCDETGMDRYPGDGGIEGISNSDSFFIEIEERNDIIVYRRLGAIFDRVDMTATLTDVIWDNPFPDPADATRWARSEMIKGWDEITPYIADLYPRDEVSTNDFATDILCDEENDSIFTADSVQPIAVVAWDRGTCVDSAFMEIRYINDTYYGLPTPTNFPGRIDSISWHSPLEYAYDEFNGGISTGWEWNIKHSHRDPGSWSWTTSGWSGMSDSWSEVWANEVCGSGAFCGKDTFWVMIGEDRNGDWMPPFIDGAYVQVTYRVFSRTNNFRYDRPGVFSPGVMNDTLWTFKVDLSGPNAELTCPSAEGHDGETREFSSNRRSYTIEGNTVYWAWLADSLPTLHIDLTDDYQEVHDTDNHGITRWSGAFGGAGMNWRDFEITFAIEHCDGEWDTIVVNESHLGYGVWVDEADNGYDAEMIINFEELAGYYSGLVPFESGDFVWVLLTELVDDPDYGQGSQGGGVADIYPSDSWGTSGGADGNYGTQSTTLYGDDHIPVMWEVVGVAPGYVSYEVDTLGVLHFDLEGPTAPDTFFYPPKEWVTSDSFQIITLNAYDQIGCYEWDMNVDLPLSDSASIYNRVSGIYSGSIDEEARICMNLKVRGCDGSWHPYYHDPAYGGSVPDGRNFCVGEPDAIALDVTKKHNEWGVRITYDPYRRMPTQAHFRPGDEVCVTVYAWDNAITECQSEDGEAGPVTGWDDDNDPWLGTYDLLCSDATIGHTVDYEVPSRNEGYDRLDPDYLYYTVSHIARWTFYVDCHAPIFTEADMGGFCNDTMYFKFRDVSANVHDMYCDNWVAKIGEMHGEMVEGCDIVFTFTDTMTPGGPYTDEIIFQDLKYGEVHVAYHEIPGRDYQYYHAQLIPDPDDSRGAILKLYGDGSDATCNFFQPHDIVDWELYAGDSPDVPWYPASEVCVSGGCYRWWHTNDPYSSPTSSFMSWRYGRQDYTDLNVDTLGPTHWLDISDMHDWYNPNWDMIQDGNFVIQSETWLNSVMWFNDGAYDAYQTAGDYNYPPDLTGMYETMFAAWSGYYIDMVLDREDGDAEAYSVMEETDPYIDFYAKDLNFIVAEIYTCTDSIIWECLAGSDPDEDTLTGRVPHVVLELRDAEDELVWTIDEWYDCDCIPCFLHYYPERTGCVDWGRLHVGPIDQDSVWLYTIRRIDTLETEPELVTDTIIGYQHGDVIDVTLTFNVREPNDFGDGDNYTKHVFGWMYEIDMQAPVADFLNPDGTTGYEEVNCHLVHDENNEIRLRLEDIYDANVGCAPGLTIAPNWTTIWPIPAVDPSTDYVRYFFGTADDEDAGMVYNPGTEPYYYWTSDGYEIHNCARETIVARSMDMGFTAQIYHGLDRSGAVPTPVTSSLTRDTIFIADSIYAEAVIQDRLGNCQLVTSKKMGLDNTTPKVKGFALATMDVPVIGTDSLGTPIYGDPTVENWDSDLFKLPWEVPDQDSLVGIYNFSDVCTVIVRLWFNDNMDMREADHLYGHIVRFQPQGWTHWFPVLPFETVAAGGSGLHYPLAQYYVDYSDVSVDYPFSRPAPDGDEAPMIPGSSAAYDDGWNSDREWIGYMVLAGAGAMDGIGKLRVQGFDDNAANYMMAVEYPIRIVTGMPWGISLEWPRVDEYDTEPVDPWSGYHDDIDRLSGWSVTEGELEDSTRCTFDADPREKELTGYWDNTLAETDSVVFKLWWSTEPFVAGTTLTTGYTYHWVEDNMYSDNIWIEGDTSWIAIPTDDIDILHEYYASLGGAPTLYSDNEMYLHIVMEAYSRFRPIDPFLTTKKLNVLIDNKRIDPVMTYLGGGEVIHGEHTVLPYGSTKLKICWSNDDNQRLEQIDKMTIWLHSLIDGTNYSLWPDSATEDYFAPVGASAPLYYDPSDSIICLEYENPEGLPPGMWTVSWKSFDAIHNVIEYGDSIEEYWTYYHRDCEFDFFDEDTLTILRPPFVARGADLEDALMSVSQNFSAVENSDDIFPWWLSGMENEWPDWPTWGWIDADAIGSIDTLPDFYRVEDFHPIIQVTTFNNPDYTSSDPLMHPYTETGGYPGDSLYVLLEVMPTDIHVEYIDLHIADYWGGDISGSNPEIMVRLDSTDIYMVGERNFWVYKWTVDDQDNRYDGLVKIVATEHTWSEVSEDFHDWDHVGYILLDTYDPSYSVDMLRDDSTVPFRAVNPIDYPGEEYIWVVNEGRFNLMFDWDETMFDPAASGDPVAYYNYSEYVYTRMWDMMRLTIDGMPIYGMYDDPNDHLESRLWDDDRDEYDIHNNFWRQPDYMAPASPSSYDDAAVAYTFDDKLDFFSDDVYAYEWDVAGEPEGLDAQGIARLLVKGRDAAGNILDYGEALESEAIGKFVLVDIEDPIIDDALIVATGETFTGFTGAFDDNYLGDNYTDMGGNGYVYIIVTDGDGAMLGDTMWVDPAGAVSSTPWVGVSPEPSDLVNVTAYDLAGNATTVGITVVPEEHCCTYTLCTDWNLIGISVMPDPVPTVGDMFPGMTVYRMVDGDYVAVPPADLLVAGEGLAIYPSIETEVEICGVPVESFSVDLVPGWNLIGATWINTDFATPHTTPPDAVDATETRVYDCGVDYVTTNTLTHCRGHLVMALEECVLDVPGDPGRKVVYTIKDSKIEPIFTGRLVADNATVTFGAANGATSDFDRAIDHYAIPVRPGTGTIELANGLDTDYRAVDNTITWDVTADAAFTATVELSTSEWTLSYEGATVVDGSVINVTPGTHKMVANRVAIPEAFALCQNLPNPFNATTVISYEIPVNSEVSLEVYSVLGQKVTTLVSGEVEAGYRSVVWDGTDSEGKPVPTGIYFYKLDAGSFKATAKMALMK
ncbi:T9SS type A sorting domain-containing protein [bacterium]|nr:T9SS type A sorting domain-containing protein [bacterium]